MSKHFHELGHEGIHRNDLTPMDTDKLWVVTCISNTRRYKTRYNLYRKFAKHMADCGANLLTIEVAYGDRPFEISHENNPYHIRLRTNSEIWHKENMLNIAIGRLASICPDWKYVAWIDSDIQFSRSDIVQETIHMLQHHQVVQMWSTAHDLDPNQDSFRTYRSFCYCYQQDIMMPFDNPDDNGQGGTMRKNNSNVGIVTVPTPSLGRYHATGSRPYWHSGYAWAARREAIDHLGGLIDWAILGSADHHMALAFIGEVERSLPKQLHGGRYHQELVEWQNRSEKFIQRNIGYVSGTIIHYWHGRKANRRYNDRWKILTRHSYDPTYDLKKDASGLWQLTDRNFKLRDDLRFYFSQRSEDCIYNDE